MPILIITIYYINDLATLQRWHSQTQFVAYQMAQMIQTISQNRSSKAITADDLRNIVGAAYLSIYPGTTMFTENNAKRSASFFGHNPLGYIYYVKGNDDGTASVVWGRRFHIASYQMTSPSKMSVDTYLGRSNVKNLQNAAPSEIYPSLTMKPGDKKIIVECCIHYSQSGSYYFTDGRATANVSPSKAFGLYLLSLTPPKTRNNNDNDAIYFSSAVIFSPNPYLFTDTAPQ